MPSQSTLPEFQFQYGAIKSEGSINAKLGKIGFQFQYGAIKSLTVDRLTVRGRNFNSNMVRLRDYTGGIKDALAQSFQFQYGAIKRF